MKVFWHENVSLKHTEIKKKKSYVFFIFHRNSFRFQNMFQCQCFLFSVQVLFSTVDNRHLKSLSSDVNPSSQIEKNKSGSVGCPKTDVLIRGVAENLLASVKKYDEWMKKLWHTHCKHLCLLTSHIVVGYFPHRRKMTNVFALMF